MLDGSRQEAQSVLPTLMLSPQRIMGDVSDRRVLGDGEGGGGPGEGERMLGDVSKRRVPADGEGGGDGGRSVRPRPSPSTGLVKLQFTLRLKLEERLMQMELAPTKSTSLLVYTSTYGAHSLNYFFYDEVWPWFEVVSKGEYFSDISRTTEDGDTVTNKWFVMAKPLPPGKRATREVCYILPPPQNPADACGEAITKAFQQENWGRLQEFGTHLEQYLQDL